MKLVKDGIVVYPEKVLISKSDKPTTNRATIIIPANVYNLFEVQDSVLLYNDDKILFNGYVTNKQFSLSNEPTAQIDLNDKMSLFLNRIWSEDFDETDEKSRSPLIIGSIIGKVTSGLKGTILTRLNIKFVGYPRTDGIQVTVTNHPEIEFTLKDMEDDTPAWQDFVNLPESDKFQKITYSAYARPVYEIVTELLEENNTGLKEGFTMIIDENDNLLLYRDSSLSTQTYDLFPPYTIKETQESELNYLIIYCGEDLNGNPIYTYAYKPYSGNPNLQESLKNWSDIARDLKPKYTDNDLFREVVKKKAQDRAYDYFERMTEGIANGQFWASDILFDIGDIIEIKDSYNNKSHLVKINGYSLQFSPEKGIDVTYKFKEKVK